MRQRGPIRYRNLDIDEKPTPTRLANIRAIDQLLTNPDCGAHLEGEPRWFIVRCESGQERIAMAHLCGRRFGVFLPEKRTNVPLFPSYLFVYSRNIEHDHHRILSMPGVLEIMQHTSGTHASLSFDMIDKIRKDENLERSKDMDKIYRAAYTKHVRKRRARRTRRIKRMNRGVDKTTHGALTVQAALSLAG